MAEVEILQQKGYNFLWIDDKLWMWDVPQEIEDQKEIARQAYGDVLVAGYGLGIIQQYLLENKKVNSVLSIEKFEKVIKECERVYGKIYGEVEIGDFYEYNTSREFDCVIGDIWEDQSLNFIEDYIKFKEKAKTLLKGGGKIFAWGMDYMEYLLKRK